LSHKDPALRSVITDYPFGSSGRRIMKERPRFRRSKLDVAPPPLRRTSLRYGG